MIMPTNKILPYKLNKDSSMFIRKLLKDLVNSIYELSDKYSTQKLTFKYAITSTVIVYLN